MSYTVTRSDAEQLYADGHWSFYVPHNGEALYRTPLGTVTHSVRLGVELCSTCDLPVQHGWCSSCDEMALAPVERLPSGSVHA